MFPGMREFQKLVRTGPDPDPRDGEPVRVCEACGAVRMEGDWPNCPHGKVTNFGDEPLEPYIDEHILSDGKDVGKNALGQVITGTLITSRGQRRKIMDQHQLEFRKKRTDLLPSGNRYFDMGRR